MEKRLYRSRRQVIIAGVCGGLADYFNVAPTLIRLVWALMTIFTIGTGLLAYVVALIIMPLEP